MKRITSILVLLLAVALAQAQQSRPTEEATYRQQLIRQAFKDLTLRMLESAKLLEQGEPESAAAIRQAVDQAQRAMIDQNMSKVADYLSRGLGTLAGSAQGSVVQDLKAVLTVLEGGAIDQQKLREDIKRYDDLLAKLQPLLAKQQELLKETEKAAARDEHAGQAEKQSGALKQQESPQRDLAKEAAKTAEQMRQPSSPGETNVTAAKEQMERAAGELAQEKAPSAAEAQKQAADELQQAIEQLQQAIQQAQEALQAQTLAAMQGQLAQMLAAQKALSAATGQMDEQARTKPLERPEQLKLADMAAREGDLAAKANKLHESLKDEDSAVMPGVLEEVKGDLQSVQKDLAQQRTGQLTQQTQKQVEQTLEELIASLSSEMQRRQAEGNATPPSGGGGQGGKNSLVPTMAELKMLAALQKQVNARTAQADADEKDPQKLKPLTEPLAQRQGRIKQWTDKLDEKVAAATGQRSLAEPSQEMGQVQQRLSSADAGKQTQQQEQKILEALELTMQSQSAAAQKQQSQGAQAKGQEQAGENQGGSQTPSTPRQPHSPAQTGSLPGGNGRSEGLNDVRPSDPSDDWGKLPPEQRQKLLEDFKEAMPERYRDMIRDYYKHLAGSEK